jgi:hypothetical protein
LQPIATGLNKPLAIVSPGDGSGRLFIAQQGGKILVYDGTRVLSTPFLDISSLVTCCGEQGLLGLAFHPDYVNNGLFYIDYTDINGDTVVARYSVSTQADIADPNSVVTVLTVFPPLSTTTADILPSAPMVTYMSVWGTAEEMETQITTLRTWGRFWERYCG